MPLRFTHDAAHTLRRAIEEAGGVEVFAIGDVEEGVVTEVVVTCRGRRHEVTALVDRPRAGQVVIHNHPSGDLEPSDADMALASRYGEDGVGVVIVDSAVGHSHWVVEPHVHREVAVDPARLERFFDEALRGVVGRSNEYHALIVRHGKAHCRRRPVCPECPLADICGAAEASAWEGE